MFLARILTYVDDQGRDKQVLVSSADGIADIKLSAEDGKFSGDLKLRKLNVRLHRSAIGGIDPDSIAQLAPLAKTFLGPQLARGLKQGLPYPLKVGVLSLEVCVPFISFTGLDHFYPPRAHGTRWICALGDRLHSGGKQLTTKSLRSVRADQGFLKSIRDTVDFC